MDIKFSNNASSSLVEAVSDSATSITVLSGTGALFPDLTNASDYFMITVVDTGNGEYEIMKVSRKSSDTFTVIRAQEGTTARTFSQNSIVENRFTAGSIEKVLNDISATTTEEGRIRIATAAEVEDGLVANAAITPATFAPVSTMPGTITMFSGVFDASGYPIDGRTSSSRTDWHICDGSHGTPNLTDKFIVGAGGTYLQGSTGGLLEDTPTITIGETALTVLQMPAHSHTYVRRVGRGTEEGFGETGSSGEYNTSTTGSGQPHGHTGTSTAVKTIPPYYALSFIMKLN